MAEKELRLGYVRGRDGIDGKSAYQAAVEEGYTGTEEQLYAAPWPAAGLTDGHP